MNTHRSLFDRDAVHVEVLAHDPYSVDRAQEGAAMGPDARIVGQGGVDHPHALHAL